MGLNIELQEMHRILQVSLENGDVNDRLVEKNPVQSSNTFTLSPVLLIGSDPLQ